MRPMLLLTFAAIAAFLLPGCIVWDIRDQLKQANAQLAEVNGSVTVTHSEIQQVKNRLNTMNADLGTTNDKLLEANTKLVDVQSGLTRVDTTNSSLGTLDQQLTSMQASLTKIDGHLASLRGTIGKLDSAIPFLDLGGDDTEELASERDHVFFGKATRPKLPVDRLREDREGAGVTGSFSGSEREKCHSRVTSTRSMPRMRSVISCT